MMNWIKFSRWIWELPQCLLGFILIHLYNVKYSETYKGIDVYKGDFPGAISLGLYILMNKRSGENTKKHEWGHTRQSLRWGWLYLPVVGLASISWGKLRDWSKKLKKRSYYSVWPENAADKLGKVKRK